MRPEEMQVLIAKDVAHIPRGTKASGQNFLRMMFQITRESHLSQNPNAPAAGALKVAIDTMRRQHPDFDPRYDHEYFGEL